MFTGIIEEKGKFLSGWDKSGKHYIRIACSNIHKDLKIGDSVACNGICLTVVNFDYAFIDVEIMKETLSKTTAVYWKKDSLINLERALNYKGRIDGHMVQGHVDHVVKLTEKSAFPDGTYLTFHLDQQWYNYVIPQGSIALNGVSLTIARLLKASFTVSLIGHTLRETNLSELKAGDLVNVEYDLIGKYVVRILEEKKDVLNEKYLMEKGF